MTPGVEVIKRLYAAFGRGDLDAALALTDPAVVFVEQFPYPGTYVGRTQLRQVFEKVIAEFDRYDMSFDRFLEDDDLVVVLGRYQVHKRGAEREVESTFVHAFWMRAGMVARYEQWLDTDYARSVVGRLQL